jgi:hypothetical protein
MADDAALMVEWGMPLAGREGRALEEFFAHVQWWGELQASGKIREFRVYNARGGDISRGAGFVLVEGTSKQIEAFSSSDEFRKSICKVSLITSYLNVRHFDVGDNVTKQMQIYGSALKELKP